MKKFTHCGGYGLGVPPVPIPNTEVKPQHADGTWLETARESRSLPHSLSPLAVMQAGLFFNLSDRCKIPRAACFGRTRGILSTFVLLI